MTDSSTLAAQFEPFDSYWEGPEDIEKGYRTLGAFYEDNYLGRFPEARDARILVISCGPGYLLKLLAEKGYTDVLGIDSEADKIEHAKGKGLDCERARAFEYLEAAAESRYDVIFCEQELNHLTKQEMLRFVALARSRLKVGGRLIGHGLNGANPITGAEALAQNFDHYNTFTAYTFEQVLAHSGFEDVETFPLNLYVFWKNPANYVLLAYTKVLYAYFRLMFIIHGKHNKLWTKKIGGMGYRRS